MSYLSNPIMPSGAQLQMAQSIIEARQPLGSTINQHFVEWFSGDALDSIWTERGDGGSKGMSDSVNGGYFMTTGTTALNEESIHFNNIRHYSHTGSAFIAVGKISSISQAIIYQGMSGSGDFVLTTDTYHIKGDSAAEPTANRYSMVTNDNAGGQNIVQSTKVYDTNFHIMKGQINSTTARGIMDGVLEAISTSQLPTAKMEPTLQVLTRNTSAKTSNFTYFEAYNT